MNNSTITITFGENVENHVGNQNIGIVIESGITCNMLKNIKKQLNDSGYNCKIINLTNDLPEEYIDNAPNASILIVKNFVNTFFKNDNKNTEMYQELKILDWDKKALMRGKVVNKHARWNLCFADFAQVPNYESGKGRIYDFKNMTNLRKMRIFLQKLISDQLENNILLNAEGNYYYDTKECYIGYHGDAERRVVIGVRFGDTFPLYYQWYHKTKSISEPHKINLKNGNMYIMSDKAVGYDWKKQLILTLRHGAGNIN